jgi:DMSO/TMAO reductase YedYZ molybdopterin-dependent catalytic subunit
MNRREFLQGSALSATLMVLRPGQLYAGDSAFAGGKFVGLVEFLNEGGAPVGVHIGSELDGRLYTDLSHLREGSLSTPSEEFYIRTRASQLLPDSDAWGINLDGLAGRPARLEISALKRAAKPMGLHLMECAGNGNRVHFGMISAATWDGVPIAEILDRERARPGASRVLISGFDRYAGPTYTSIPGASWIFKSEELKAAFLATAMNGQPLTRDHGAPIRLMVPGWYGCACIKWVNGITFVDEGAEATSQMREYAGRTLQQGVPQFAKDYQPASADHAALPIRIEKWMVGGKPKYRVVGILWGGSQLVRMLQIRFRAGQAFLPVDRFRQTRIDPWTLWTHTWSVQEPGLYTIRMAVTNPHVQARKLDSGFYDRVVRIDDV